MRFPGSGRGIQGHGIAGQHGNGRSDGDCVDGSDVANANAVLKVAGKAESLEVTAEVPIINSEDQTISDTITSQAVIEPAER